MIGVQLLQLLEQAGRVTPADLEQIDRQITVLQAFRDFAAAKLVAAPAPAALPPAPAKASPAPTSAPDPAGVEGVEPPVEEPRGNGRPPLPDAGAATPAVGPEKAAAASPREPIRHTFPADYHAARRDAQRERRLAIARLIRDAGPLGMAEIAKRTGTPYGSMSKLMDCDWFEKVGPGMRDPYRLTAAGQAALEAATTAG